MRKELNNILKYGGALFVMILLPAYLCAQSINVFEVAQNETIEICGSELLELHHIIDTLSDYGWNWQLGDGTISVLSNTVKHLYNPEIAMTYHVEVTHKDIAETKRFKIKVIGQEIGVNFNFDSIYCLNQNAIISFEKDESYIPKIQEGKGYEIISNFNTNGKALLNFNDIGESEIAILNTKED